MLKPVETIAESVETLSRGQFSPSHWCDVRSTGVSGVWCQHTIFRGFVIMPLLQISSQSPGTVLRKINQCILISAKFMTACRSEVIVSNTVIFMSIQFTNLSIKSFIHDLSLSEHSLPWSSGAVWSLWNAISVPAITTITWSYSPQSNSNAKLPDRLIIKWNLQSFVSGDQAVSTFKRWIAGRRLRLDNCNDVRVEFQWINNLVYKLLSCVQWPIHHPSDLIWSLY